MENNSNMCSYITNYYYNKITTKNKKGTNMNYGYQFSQPISSIKIIGINNLLMNVNTNIRYFHNYQLIKHQQNSKILV